MICSCCSWRPVRHLTCCSDPRENVFTIPHEVIDVDDSYDSQDSMKIWIFRVWSLFTFGNIFLRTRNQTRPPLQERAGLALLWPLLGPLWPPPSTPAPPGTLGNYGKLHPCWESAAGLGVKLSSQIGTNLIHATIVCKRQPRQAKASAQVVSPVYIPQCALSCSCRRTFRCLPKVTLNI